MISGRGRISEKHKQMLDELRDALDFERPKILQIALAKGIEGGTITDVVQSSGQQGKWEFQWDTMSSSNILLFKHLIIQSRKETITDDDLKKYMQQYIESGLEILMEIKASRTSIEDLRFSII